MKKGNGHKAGTYSAVENAAHEWRAVLDSIKDPISVHDRDFNIVRANRAFAEFAGIGMKDINGKKCYEVLHELNCPADYCPMKKAMPGRRPLIKEVYDGDMDRHLEITVARLKGGTGRDARFIHRISDITERKRTQYSLESMIETFPLPLLEVDISEVSSFMEKLKRRRVRDLRRYIRRHPGFVGNIIKMLRVVNVNKAMVDLYGASDKDECLNGFKSVFVPESEQLMIDQAVAMFDGHFDMEFEGITRKFSGELNHVTIKWSTPLKGKEGRTMMIAVSDITDRKRLEAALKESRDLYMARFEESPISLWDKDYSRIKIFTDELRKRGVRDFRKHFRDHPEDLQYCATLIRVTDINQATVEMYGAQDKEDFKGNLHKIFCDETWNCFLNEVLYVTDRRSSRKSETLTKKFSGEENNILVRWTLPEQFPKDYSRMLFSIMDITEQKKIENALRESEKRFRAAATSTADLLWEGDIRIDSLTWFGDIDSMLGYEIGEFPRTISGHMSHIHAEDRQWMEREIGKALQTGKDFHATYRIRMKGGEYRYWDERGKAVEFEDGRAVRWIGSVTDITDRMTAERSLQESEELYRTTFENAGIGIAHVEKDGRFIRVNEKLCEIAGFDREKIMAMNVLDIVYPDDLDECKRQMISLVNGSESGISCEKRFVRDKSEIVWTHTTVTPFKDRSGSIRHLIMLVDDITDRKKMENEAKEIQLRLLHTNKMAALGTLVSGVAHEINNPNSFILSNTEIFADVWKDACRLLEEYGRELRGFTLGGLAFDDLRDVVPDMLEGIRGGAERIGAIVDNLKNFTRGGTSEINEDVIIGDVLETALQFLGPEIKKHNLTLNLKIDPGSRVIKGNSKGLEQVVINLVINAIQAVSGRRDGRVYVSSFYDESSTKVVIKVKDNGKGIHESLLERVTEPFFTTRIDEGGTGLGLSISYAIVNDHSGFIDIKSKVGMGTTVRVMLPVQT